LAPITAIGEIPRSRRLLDDYIPLAAIGLIRAASVQFMPSTTAASDKRCRLGLRSSTPRQADEARLMKSRSENSPLKA
jgi:hypothetical protein